MFAPIGLSTYTRLDHLRHTIETLQQNTLAAESELYIFSDGAKAGDEEKVHEIRKYLKTISGFKRVEIIERAGNWGLDNNSMRGIQDLLNTHNRFVWLEEDCVTAPSFLQFMNQTLDVYERNPKIFSISGYCPPIKIPEDYPFDVYLLPRFCAWGFGTWKDRFKLVPMVLGQDKVDALFRSPKEQYGFGAGGLDMFTKLKKEVKTPHAPDVRIFFLQYQLGMDTIYPTSSLVRNIGLDGSGTHSPKSNFKDVDLIDYEKLWHLPVEIRRDKRIIKNNFLFRLRGGKKFRPTRGILWLIPFLLYRLVYRKSFPS